MTEFWEASFSEKQAMWGFEPAEAAIWAKDFFLAQNVQEILIPGIGYGRNARIFLDNGIGVTGIEISKTAIDLARQNGLTIPIYHGSVTDMPFDAKLYDGIFCYALIHLLNRRERKKLINDCYRQLKPDGQMIFTVVSKQAPMFGAGQQLSKNRFQTDHGVKLFFYDAASVRSEFGGFGLVECREIDEPVKNKPQHPVGKFLMVRCKKV